MLGVSGSNLVVGPYGLELRALEVRASIFWLVASFDFLGCEFRASISLSGVVGFNFMCWKFEFQFRCVALRALTACVGSFGLQFPSLALKT